MKYILIIIIIAGLLLVGCDEISGDTDLEEEKAELEAKIEIASEILFNFKNDRVDPPTSYAIDVLQDDITKLKDQLKDCRQ